MPQAEIAARKGQIGRDLGHVAGGSDAGCGVPAHIGDLYEEDFIVEGMERDDPEGRVCKFIFKNRLENLKVGWDLSLKQFGEGRVFEVYICPPEETGGFFGVGFKEDKSQFKERSE